MVSDRDLQRALIAAGYPLPRYGADGVIGEETHEACVNYARDELVFLFNPGDPNTYRRKGPPRSIALHWTAGRRGAEGVVETLKSRRLSINYIIEGSGRTVQCAEDMTQTAHIGDGNESAIGIECVSMGLVASSNLARSKFLGRNYTFAPWPSEQLAAVVDLCETLCARWEIPRVLAPVKRGLELDFEGVVGHYNWHASKLDPGPFPFAALEAAGFTYLRA